MSHRPDVYSFKPKVISGLADMADLATRRGGVEDLADRDEGSAHTFAWGAPRKFNHNSGNAVGKIWNKI
jgi:hypothetical protein